MPEPSTVSVLLNLKDYLKKDNDRLADAVEALTSQPRQLTKDEHIRVQQCEGARKANQRTLALVNQQLRTIGYYKNRKEG